MNNILARSGWIAIGIVIGVIGTSSLGAVREQTPIPPPDGSRLTVRLASTGIGPFAFVKDTKSEGCWIVMTKNDGVSVAPAPLPACQ